MTPPKPMSRPARMTSVSVLQGLKVVSWGVLRPVLGVLCRRSQAG